MLWCALTRRTDDDLLIDHLDPNLPLWDVVQVLCSSDPTEETRPRSCRSYASTRQHELDHSNHGYICPEELNHSGNRWSVRDVIHFVQNFSVEAKALLLYHTAVVPTGILFGVRRQVNNPAIRQRIMLESTTVMMLICWYINNTMVDVG